MRAALLITGALSPALLAAVAVHFWGPQRQLVKQLEVEVEQASLEELPSRLEELTRLGTVGLEKLVGDRIVGRVDLKADRKSSTQPSECCLSNWRTGNLCHCSSRRSRSRYSPNS